MSQSTEAIKHELKIGLDQSGQRIDTAVAQLLPEYSRSVIKQWILQGMLLRNGSLCKPKDIVYSNDSILICATLEQRSLDHPEAITLEIIYEDESLIIINKPVGLVVHPGNGHSQGTLVNGLLHHCPELADLPRAGLIHRIDKGTSGLLIIAKHLIAHNKLAQALMLREVKRQYYALVQGEMISGGTVDAPIGRHPQNRVKMAVVNHGKPAKTHFRIAERLNHYTLTDVTLDTGRTHQIRVHMQHIGYPIVGDPLYNPRLKLPKHSTDECNAALRDFQHQALHAYRLSLNHPITDKTLEWQVPIPKDFSSLLETLRQNTADNHN